MPRELVTRRYARTRLVAFYDSDDRPGRRRHVNLAPSTTYVAGQAMGRSGVAANDVQTLTTTGVPTGGSQTWRFTDPISGATADFAVPFDSSSATAQTNIRAAIGNSDVVVSGGAQPGTPLVFTFSGTRYASKPVGLMTLVTNALTGGTSPVGAMAQTTLGRTAGTYGKYVGGGATDPCKGLLEYGCVTDAQGYITYGGQTYTGESTLETSTPMWTGGVFRLGDTTGLDAGAITDLSARFESGDINDPEAIIVIP
jgi:hypothetical protein